MKYNFSKNGANLVITLDVEGGKYNPEIVSINDPNITLENNNLWLYENGKYLRFFLYNQIGTIDGLVPTSIEDAYAKLNVIVNSLALLASPKFKGSVVPTDTPVGTDDAFWIATQAGTYTLFGNFTLPANTRAEISRVGGEFSVSQTPLVIPDTKIKPFVNQAYAIDSQVSSLGKFWYNNDATAIGEIPASSSKWVELLSGKGLFTESIVSPVVYVNNPLVQKMTAIESQSPNGSGFGWLLDRNTFKGHFNFFSAFIHCSSVGESVTMKIYKTTDFINTWSPTSLNTTLLFSKVFTDFNANSSDQFECFFDDTIEYPANSDLYIYFENANKKLRMFRNEYSYTGQSSMLLELRNPQNNYFLDATGLTTQFPILALVNKMEYQINKDLAVDVSSKIVIPNVVYAVVGKEMNIYKNSILDISNGLDSFEIILKNITLDWTSNGDSSGITINDRSLKFKPTTAGQTHLIRCDVLDYKRKVIGRKDFAIKTVSKISGTGTKNIIMVGDSLTEGGGGESALKLYNSIIADGGFTPVMVGSKTNTTNSAVKHEGYSGQTFDFFMGAGSPFYIGGEINFQTYASAKGVASLDIFHIQCGINDVLSGVFFSLATLIPDIITNLTTIVDKVLSPTKGFPNCKIIISLEPFGANGENFSASRSTNELKRKMMLLNKAILAKFYQDETGFKYNANVWVSPNHLTIDRDYGYPYEMVKVCEFADVSQTEKQFSDTIHPNNYGQEQIANSVYSMIRKIV